MTECTAPSQVRPVGLPPVPPLTTALLTLWAALAVPSTVRAGVPTPSNSTCPPCIVLDPAGTARYRVVARDFTNNPSAGVNVRLDFGAASGFNLCLESDPDRDRQVHATTNAEGVADFYVRGGGLQNAATIQVYGDTEWLATVAPRSPDLDGNLQIDVVDLDLFGALPAGSASGDFDCDGDRDGADSLAIVQRLWHKCFCPLSLFPVVHSPNPADYANCQLKFSYLGAQTVLPPSLGGVGPGRPFALGAFTPYQRTSGYLGDTFVADTLALSLAEFKAFVDRIGERSFLHDTASVANPQASLMLLCGSGAAERCWEFLAPTSALTDTLFQLLHDSVTSPAMKGVVTSFRHHMAGIRGCP